MLSEAIIEQTMNQRRLFTYLPHHPGSRFILEERRYAGNPGGSVAVRGQGSGLRHKVYDWTVVA